MAAPSRQAHRLIPVARNTIRVLPKHLRHDPSKLCRRPVSNFTGSQARNPRRIPIWAGALALVIGVPLALQLVRDGISGV